MRTNIAPDDTEPTLDITRWYFRGVYLRCARTLSAYHRTHVSGAPVPVGRCIYVSHHGAGYFVLDLAVAVYELAWRSWHERRGPPVPLRVLATQGHGMERAIPGLATAKRQMGLVAPTQRAALAVLSRGEQLLITPGGRREATPAARHYRLRWRDRFGFVRLAIATGTPIVPLAVVGGFDAYPGVALGKGALWSPIPLPARLDVVVGKSIEVPCEPERATDRATIEPIHRAAWQATQTLYDTVLAERSAPRGRRTCDA